MFASAPVLLVKYGIETDRTSVALSIHSMVNEIFMVNGVLVKSGLYDIIVDWKALLLEKHN
jgi:hypothetical protein